LKLLHPENNNIKPKIRQQLQFLRDKWYLGFLEKGMYRVI
jgi:type II restriction enzyme